MGRYGWPTVFKSGSGIWCYRGSNNTKVTRGNAIAYSLFTVFIYILEKGSEEIYSLSNLWLVPQSGLPKFSLSSDFFGLRIENLSSSVESQQIKTIKVYTFLYRLSYQVGPSNQVRIKYYLIHLTVVQDEFFYGCLLKA